MSDVEIPVAPSGRFCDFSLAQTRRLHALRLEIREHREKYENLLLPDPFKATDKDGAPYWGSNLHLLGTMLLLMERHLGLDERPQPEEKKGGKEG